jgi:DNA repair ATPase RecN
MAPQKRSKKNTSAETDQEEHHHDEGNRISLTPEPSNITDQERRAKLEALQRARAEKTAHTLEQLAEQQTHENNDDDDDDEAIDKELERVQQKIQHLQKEKEKFANQLQAKRKVSEKLEKLNQVKEQIEQYKEKLKKCKNKRTTHCGKTHHTRTLVHTEEPRKKMFSRVMESHNSWILNHHSQ